MESKLKVQNNIGLIIYQEDTRLEGANELLDALPKWLDEVELVGIILDLSIIDMLNSSGIGVLVSIAKTVIKKDVPFIVVVNDYVDNILQVVGLHEILKISDTMEEALISFQQIPSTLSPEGQAFAP